MKPFLFETTDMIDTNPKKYIGPPVDPKTGKFKCSKHGKEDACFKDDEVHTSEIPDEKVFFKPKEKKSMKENDSLFSDEDFEILEADHKKYDASTFDGAAAKLKAQQKAEYAKREHKGLMTRRNPQGKALRYTAKGDAKLASHYGRKAINLKGYDSRANVDSDKADIERERVAATFAQRALKKSPNRLITRGDVETLTRGAVKESFNDFLEAGGYLPPPSKNPNPAKPPIRGGKTAFEYEQVQKRRAAENAPTKKSPIDYMKIKKKDVKESFNDEDFEILEADHKKYPEGSGRKFLAQINARERKDIHKGLKKPANAVWDEPEKTAKGYAKSASSEGRKEGRNPGREKQAEYSTAKYDAWSSRHDARMALSVGNPMRPKKKGDIEILTRGAVKESRSFNDFLNRAIEESETPAPQTKKFDHNSAILKWELEAVGIRAKNAPIVENPTTQVDYTATAKTVFEKHKAKEVPITIPANLQEAINKREKGNATLTKAFYDEYK